MPFNAEEIILELEQVKPINKFFSNFFPRSDAYFAEELKVQVKKGKIKMAPFVSPRKGGVIMAREGMSSYTITPPRISVDKLITLDDLLKKTMGETVISTKTPEERAYKMYSDDMVDSLHSIEGRIEWMARETMLKGNINVVDVEEGVDINIDYNFDNSKTLSDGATWADEDGDILQDVMELAETILDKSGVNPTYCIMGKKARTAFLKNKKVQEELDNRNIHRGEIRPKLIDDHLKYYGEIDGIQYYCYIESFINDNGVIEQMMPENKIILTSKINGETKFGSVTQINASGEFETYASAIVPKEVVDKDNDIKKTRLTSRPITVPTDVDAWGVMTVVDESYEG